MQPEKVSRDINPEYERKNSDIRQVVDVSSPGGFYSTVVQQLLSKDNSVFDVI